MLQEHQAQADEVRQELLGHQPLVGGVLLEHLEQVDVALQERP